MYAESKGDKMEVQYSIYQLFDQLVSELASKRFELYRLNFSEKTIVLEFIRREMKFVYVATLWFRVLRYDSAILSVYA